MTHVARPTEFQRDITPYRRPVASEAVPQPGLLARLFDAVFENRQRQAQRDVEAYLARSGHRLTDSIEREIDKRLFSSGWNASR